MRRSSRNCCGFLDDNRFYDSYPLHKSSRPENGKKRGTLDAYSQTRMNRQIPRFQVNRRIIRIASFLCLIIFGLFLWVGLLGNPESPTSPGTRSETLSDDLSQQPDTPLSNKQTSSENIRKPPLKASFTDARIKRVARAAKSSFERRRDALAFAYTNPKKT